MGARDPNEADRPFAFGRPGQVIAYYSEYDNKICEKSLSLR